MTNNAPDPLDDDRRDVQLMLALKERDALAFEELMARNQSKVASILYHFLGSSDLAEDLTQEVFTHLYRAAASYEPTARFSTWLFKIVHNIALNALRTKRRHPEKSFSDTRETDRSGEYPTFEESILEKSGLIPTRLAAKPWISQAPLSSKSGQGSIQPVTALTRRHCHGPAGSSAVQA